MADNRNRNQNENQHQGEHTQSRAKSGAMTPEEAGHLGGVAPRRHGMSREEAGHKGGTAPHRCRGFQCQEESSHHGHSSRSNEENE